MSTASVLHLATNGHGQKLLKTKAQVTGRFLLRPDEEFNASVARQMVDKAKRRHTKVSTELRVFDAGIQLGDHGVFAAMPIEFIKYHRLPEWTTLTNEPSTLIVCVKDYEQRCVTVMRLKDATTLKVVLDVMQKQKAAYMEDYARSPGLGSTLQRSTNGGRGGPVNATGPAAGGSRDQPDHSGPNRRYLQAASSRRVEVETKEASIQLHQDADDTAEEPDYAVIRRSQMGGPPLPPPPRQQHSGSGGGSGGGGGGFFTRITVPAGPSYHQLEQQQLEVEEQEQWQTLRRQKEQELHRLYEQRRSQLAMAQLRTIADNSAAAHATAVSDGYDEFEMAAVFETLDGPPTMLNEPARYVSRVAQNGATAAQETIWRLADQGQYYKSSSTASFGATGSGGGSLFRPNQQQQTVAQ